MLFYFAAYLLHRISSGLRNGMIYREGDRVRNLSLVPTGIMISVLLIAILKSTMTQPWAIIVRLNASEATTAILFLLCAAASVMAISRVRGWHIFPASDLHTWTFLEQVFLSALFLSFGWEAMLGACCAVYPAVVAQKASINYFVGLEWNDERTDDPTGATYSLPILGLKIAVPRLSHRIRLSLSLLSIMVLFFFIRFDIALAALFARF